MDFQIKALPHQAFAPLSELTPDELADANIQKIEVRQHPGFPCRISLRDAEIGETVFLLNYEHQSEASPYRASHAIFVIEGATQAHPGMNEVPEALVSRLLSVRAFNARHDMIAADVCDGVEVADMIRTLGKLEGVEYLHIHNARPGCFAAKVDFPDK